MLEEVLTYIHNPFIEDKAGKPYSRWSGKFCIRNGRIRLPLQRGQYFWIAGSKLNDGLHVYPTNNLRDEVFEGTVMEAVIPNPVLAIVEEIEAWKEQYGSDAASPFTSESFGGYSYAKAGSESSPTSWHDVFGKRLTKWKKVH